MKAKSGKKIEAVKPQDPEEVFAADDANPGKMAEVKSAQYTKNAGKYGQTKLPAHKPAKDAESASPSPAPTSTGNNSNTNNPNAGASSSAAQSSAEQDESKKAWVSVKLIDESGNAVAGEKYEVILPDGTLAKGTLGMDGTAKVEGFEPGKCQVSFPNLVKGSVSQK
jgi:type VI secretion system secreted protein VgrG